MSSVEQVKAQMAENDMPSLPAGHPILDGKYHRFGPKNKCWYILRQQTLKSGREAITGAFGHFVGEERNTVPVKIDYESMSDADREELSRKMRATERAEANKREEAARLAAGRARDQWNKAADNPVVHAYLERKQVTPEAVRVSEKGELLIPMTRAGQIVGLQKIDAEGGKLYNKGMDKIGAYHMLGAPVGAPIIAIGEGYATCRSARMSIFPGIDLPVAVAFDAGGILPVATAVRSAYPAAHLLFLADDDYLIAERFIERLRSEFKVFASVQLDGSQQTVLADDGEEVQVCATWRDDANGVQYLETDVRKGRSWRTYKYHNAGVTACTAAVAALGNASMVRPLFADRAGRKLTDWNDLHVEEGIEAVAAQIGVAILAAQQPINASPSPSGPEALPIASESAGSLVSSESPPPPCEKQPLREAQDGPPADFDARYDSVPPPDADVSGSPSATGGGGDKNQKKEKPKKVYGQAHWDQVDDVLENFILIYGEDLVWDCRQRMLMKISAMRTIVQNSDVMKFWGGDARKWVLKKNIVFDPSERPSPASSGPTATVNLFSGWKMRPKKGNCIQIQTLLSHLCDGNEDMEMWILRWLAYPLRNPGAKMETSIIMHGDEGSGKNFFFEKVVKAIYGEYGYVIGNAQLESNFNDWASMKLFMVADEVVTRAELKQMKGKLKYLVAGDTVIVNPKGMPEHCEANQMNFVFLSNELQPLALDKTDRRYLVVWTPPALGREFYVSVAQEIAQGGIEAFYYFLLHELDMGDFNEHTKPLYNEAKDRLIEKSLAPAERFYREWSNGYLPLPFITCSVNQLYEAFQVWCARSGEPKYTSLTLFSPTIQRYAGDAISKQPVSYEFGEKVKQRTVFFVGNHPEGKTLRDWAEAACALFEGDLKSYRSRHSANVDS